MTLAPYRPTIQPEWIDYNGHMRDAYYALILSQAIDAVMDELGLDAAYRESSHCTLYTLELHMHHLHEVKSSDRLEVVTSILDADGKRIHAGCRFACGPSKTAAATGEVMLLHVQQGGKAASRMFPPQVDQRLQVLRLSPSDRAAWGPGSRRIELFRRSAA